MTPLSDLVNRYVADDELKKATDLIEKNFRTNPNASSDLWAEYSDYMVWQKRENEIWNTLDSYYLRFKSKNNADLSRKIHTISDYPSNVDRKKWLNRQLDWNTKDVEVLEEYVDYFNTSDNTTAIRKVLKQLVALRPNSKNTKLYISHVIDTNTDDIVEELMTINSCDPNYLNLASSIAWAFADNLRFDKALEWEKCAKGINKETKDFWTISSTNFEKMKDKDYPYYIALLLANNPRKATQELKGKQSCSKDLQHMSAKIAKSFAAYSMFKRALQWAECTDDIAMIDKMNWQYETNSIAALKQDYTAYIAANPEDYDVSSLMATLLLYEGQVEESARIAFRIPTEKINKKYRRSLNEEVKSLDFADQLIIFRKFADLLDDDVREEITKNMRQERGAAISFESFSINDKFDPTAITNKLSYSNHNANGDMHTFTLAQSTLNKINGFSSRPSNIGHDLMGVEYQFTKKSSKKYKYTLRGRVERDNFGDFFFQGMANLNFAKKKKFTAYQLDVFPVQTGPGYTLGIYRIQFNGYKEMPINKKLKPILALESNYYTDDQNDHTLVGRFEYQLIGLNKFKLSPMIEGAGGIGTIDRKSGFPYWMAKNRILGGAGAFLVLGSEKSKFNLQADFGLFMEKDEPNFERYIGNASYKIKDFTKINLNYEFYTIKNFFSNVIQFGLSYNFK